MESVKYITVVDEFGHIKNLPSILEFKGKEVEVIIKPHIDKKMLRLRHKNLRDKINTKGKTLSEYICEERSQNSY